MTPAIPSTGTAAFYCRMPDGRVRIPAPDERANFCTSGRHNFCPVVQRYGRDH